MTPQTIASTSFAMLSLIVLLYALLILWRIFNNEISLNGLLTEIPASGSVDDSKASLSRFQFLIFTFVIGGLFLTLSIEAGTFVDIPTNVLGLMGISGLSYLVSKAASPKPEAAVKVEAKVEEKKVVTSTAPTTTATIGS